MSASALVSIIVRTQGVRPRLLAASLQSLARQTYTELEVLVVEDGGDRMSAIVEAANKERADTFRLLPITKAGRSDAGNAGLSAARGHLMGFLDEDDWLAPEHGELLAAALKRNPGVDLAYARAQPMFADGLADDNVRDVEPGPLEGDAPFSRTLLWLRNAIPIQAALFRRSLFERYGGLDPALDALEDWDLWLRYSAEKDFLALDAVTSTYRLPASQAERLARARIHAAARTQVLQKHADLVALHRFADIAALPERIRNHIGLRQSIRRSGAALAEKLRGRKPSS
mgnify:FL=1